MHYMEFDEGNNNNNNNNSLVDSNGNGYIGRKHDESFMKMSPPQADTMMGGAASLALQSSLTTSQNSSLLSSLEMNVHPAYDNVNTFSEDSGNNAFAEPDARYQMHSTKLCGGDSFEGFEMSSHGHRSFETMHSSSNPDDKENAASADRECMCAAGCHPDDF